jgi:hypothetical protein
MTMFASLSLIPSCSAPILTGSAGFRGIG